MRVQRTQKECRTQQPGQSIFPWELVYHSPAEPRLRSGACGARIGGSWPKAKGGRYPFAFPDLSPLHFCEEVVDQGNVTGSSRRNHQWHQGMPDFGEVQGHHRGNATREETDEDEPVSLHSELLDERRHSGGEWKDGC